MNIRAKIYGDDDYADEPLLKAKQPRGAKADELDSVAVAREARRTSNSRGEDRHRLTGERAMLTYKRRKIEVELLNLSGGGAMVSGPFEPLLWDRVYLRLGENGTIECAVRWIRGGRVGLEFAHETRLDCRPDKVAAVLRQVIARSFPDLGFGASAEPEIEGVDAQPLDDEHRSALRHPLVWTGELHHDYQTTPIRIRNISAVGAMIESETPVRVGAEPMLELGENLMIAATVVWSVGDQVGLRFQSSFDLAQLAEACPNLAPATWTPPAYLDKASDGGASPWDPRWKRLGIKQLQHELDGLLNR
jgi:hypothetical protein